MIASSTSIPETKSIPTSDIELTVRSKIGKKIRAVRKLNGIATMVSSALRKPIVNQRMAPTTKTPTRRLSSRTPMRASTPRELSRLVWTSIPSGARAA